MRRRFFDGGSSVWKPLGYLADLFLLSLLWILCCLPIVTVGPATAALYDSVARGIRVGAPFPYSRFFRSFKSGLLTACVSTIFWALVYALCLLAARCLMSSARDSSLSYALSAAGLVLLLLPVGCGAWVFPLHSRFSFSALSLNLTAIRLAFGKMHLTLVLALSILFSLWLTMRYIIPLFFFPALLMLLWSYILEPVFDSFCATSEHE